MSINESVRVETLIPDQLLETASALMLFLKKYYEFMTQEGRPTHILENSVIQRDVYQATDAFLDLLMNEYGFSWLENKDTHRANIIAHLSEIFKAKGSLESVKVLFRILAKDEVEIVLPKEYVFRPSDGTWKQDFSIMVEVIEGDPSEYTGQFVKVSTTFPGRPTQVFDVEIKNVTKRTNTVYELFISRYFTGYFHWDSIIEFEGVKSRLIPSMSQTCSVIEGGAGFKIADSYVINNFKRNYSWDYIKPKLPTDVADTLSKLFEPSEFERWVMVDQKTRRFEKELVTRWYTTDGTTHEEIKRTNTIINRVIRGRDQFDDIFEFKGLPRIQHKILENYYNAPDITINWDQLIIELTDYIVTGTCTNYFDLFGEEGVESTPNIFTAIADFNRDGVIDFDDLICLVRYSMGLSIDSNTNTDQITVRDYISQNLVKLLVERNINIPLVIDEGSGAVVRVTGIDDIGRITDLQLVSFGYNFPKIFFTYISPATYNLVYDMYVYSGYVDPDYTYENAKKATSEIVLASRAVGYGLYQYSDRKGFLSDVIKLHDGYYYQDFSYVVQGQTQPETAARWIKQTVHPAGLEVFTEQVLIGDLTYDSIAKTSEHHYIEGMLTNIYTRYFHDFIEYEDVIAKKFHKYLGWEISNSYVLTNYVIDDLYVLVPDDDIGMLDKGTITHISPTKTIITTFANDAIFP